MRLPTQALVAKLTMWFLQNKEIVIELSLTECTARASKEIEFSFSEGTVKEMYKTMGLRPRKSMKAVGPRQVQRISNRRLHKLTQWLYELYGKIGEAPPEGMKEMLEEIPH